MADAVMDLVKNDMPNDPTPTISSTALPTQQTASTTGSKIIVIILYHIFSP